MEPGGTKAGREEGDAEATRDRDTGRRRAAAAMASARGLTPSRLSNCHPPMVGPARILTPGTCEGGHIGVFAKVKEDQDDIVLDQGGL